jgi:cbb3-type cytochrome oxidase maturation protein
MDILYLLIPLSVVLAFFIGAAFWWSVHSGQFDDLEGPAHRIIADDDSPLDLDQDGGRRSSLRSRVRGREIDHAGATEDSDRAAGATKS